MKKANQLSGPRPEVRRAIHSGQPRLFGITANTYWRMNPRTKTGIAAAAVVATVVALSVSE